MLKNNNGYSTALPFFMLFCSARKAVLWEAYSLHLDKDESQPAGKGTRWKGKNYTKVKWGVLDLLLTVSVHSWGTGISPFPGFIPVFPQTCPHSPPAAAEPKGAPRQLCRSNPQTFGMCSHINMHAHVYEYLAKAPKIHASTAPFISLGMK